MTGDLFNPFLSTQEDNVLRSYAQTLRTVKLALPVNFKKIIKLVCDIA
jgi:Copine